MNVTGESILAVVRRASEETGIDPRETEVIKRRRLEAAVEAAARDLDRCSCGRAFDWWDGA